MSGPITRARARAAARAQERVTDARRPTMEPGPGAAIINAAALQEYRRNAETRAHLISLAENLGMPLSSEQRRHLARLYPPAPPSRVDGTPAVWPSPNWSNHV